MAESIELQATKKVKAVRSVGCHDENMGFYNKATKYFLAFTKDCYKPTCNETKPERRERMVSAYKFFDCVYDKTSIDTNGDERTHVDKNKYARRVEFVRELIEKELCCKCAKNRHDVDGPCIFFKADCGDFICGICYADLRNVSTFFFLLFFLILFYFFKKNKCPKCKRVFSYHNLGRGGIKLLNDELKMQIDPDFVPNDHFEVKAIIGFYKHHTVDPLVSYYRVVWKGYKQ